MEQMEAKTNNIGVENNIYTFDFEHTPITQIVDYIIINASKKEASDIHFDPRENNMVVRFRIDGDLQDYTLIPKAYERNLTTRLKILSNMNITESRLPQDGAIKGDFGGKYLDMRVSCLPVNEGEKIVIRILDYSKSLQGINYLGFNSVNLKKIKRMTSVPNGIILVTGATGSGKSTTVYSILQGLNKPETNIITVEDPIEMNIEGMNQVQVNSEIGMTFGAALRSILRQDPNIILIGEIRDSETAQIAVRASITGHLVLSTIHTNNSLSTIERLLDMDVERYLLSAALTGIISQRLAKELCPNCRIKRATTEYEKKVFKKYMNMDVDTIWDANPKGCPQCRKGYKGRIAIQEVLELDDDIRNAINNPKITKEELKKMVYTDKTITMLQDALGKCIAGYTSYSEVYRVIEIENDENNDESLTKSLDDVEITPNHTTTSQTNTTSKTTNTPKTSIVTNAILKTTDTTKNNVVISTPKTDVATSITSKINDIPKTNIFPKTTDTTKNSVATNTTPKTTDITKNNVVTNITSKINDIPKTNILTNTTSKVVDLPKTNIFPKTTDTPSTITNTAQKTADTPKIIDIPKTDVTTSTTPKTTDITKNNVVTSITSKINDIPKTNILTNTTSKVVDLPKTNIFQKTTDITKNNVATSTTPKTTDTTKNNVVIPKIVSTPKTDVATNTTPKTTDTTKNNVVTSITSKINDIPKTNILTNTTSKVVDLPKTNNVANTNSLAKLPKDDKTTTVPTTPLVKLSTSNTTTTAPTTPLVKLSNSNEANTTNLTRLPKANITTSSSASLTKLPKTNTAKNTSSIIKLYKNDTDKD